MGVYFDFEAVKNAELREYAEGARAAWPFCLEERCALLEELMRIFAVCFGDEPKDADARAFLKVMRDEMEEAKSDLKEFFGRDVD